MYRAVKMLMAGVTLVSSLIAPQAEAAFFSYPKALKTQIERIDFKPLPWRHSLIPIFACVMPMIAAFAGWLFASRVRLS